MKCPDLTDHLNALADEVFEQIAANRDGDLDLADRLRTAARAAAARIEQQDAVIAKVHEAWKHRSPDEWGVMRVPADVIAAAIDPILASTTDPEES